MATDSALKRRQHQPGEVTTTVTIPPMPAQPRSSRYKILKLHGRGGMGEIWLAEDEHIGRQVAFKRIRTDKEQVLERFFAEAQVTGQLEHPGIVPVHELGRDQDDQPFYVMRMIHGRTLKEVIQDFHAANKRGEPDEELRWLRLMNVMISLCRTISFAHSRGVIHRDLKPDNVMVGQYGETFVLDWGLCKLLGQKPEPSTRSGVWPVRVSGQYGSTATQDGEIVGSPLYMSPEMADGRIAEEDVRTDVYLLGATLYEILTNRPPRGGSTQQEIVDLARTSPPVPPRKLNPRVPRALEAICLKAMEYRNEDRYESAQAVADEIEHYLAGDPVQAYPEPLVRRAWRWAMKRRAMIGRWALAAVLLIAAGASLAAWQRDRARHEAEKQGEIAARLVAEREAARLEKLEKARSDAIRFRESEEILHDQLADTTPLDERIGVTDPSAADATWKQIQEIIARWQGGLADFPEEVDRAGIQRAYAELVLWRVQSLVAQPLNSAAAENLLADLDSIAGLQPAGYSYHRLRAACLDAAGRSALAEQTLGLVKLHRQVALDYFLEGEEKRMEALRQPSSDEDGIHRPSRAFLQEAIAHYQKCIDLDPQHFWAHLQKGRSHLVHRQEIDEALAAFNRAVAFRPESPTAWAARGLALGVLGQFPAAMHDLHYAASLKGRSLTALLNRGAIFLSQDKFDEAQADFLAVLKEDSQNLPATYYLALMHYRKQEFNRALEKCNAVLQRQPQLRPALLLRTNIYLVRRDGPRALADLTVLSSLTDSTASTPMQAARRCSLLRILAAQHDGAVKAFSLRLAEQEGQKALAGELKAATLFNDLGVVQMQLGKLPAALTSLDAGLAANPDPLLKARTHLMRGLTYLTMKDYARAKDDYTQAATIEGNEPLKQAIRAEAHALLGYIAARQSDPPLADRQAALAMAQLRSVNNWETWWNLAGVYVALADNDTNQVQELHDIAMTMITNCLFQADQTNSRAKAVQYIVGDKALAPLRDRQDFKTLLRIGE